jgi:hypothetical protein
MWFLKALFHRFWKTDFTLQLHGRAGMTYSEGGRSVNVDSEILCDEFTYTFDPNSIQKWNPPYDHQPLTDEDRERIAKNIKKDLVALGHKLDV